MWGFGAGTLIYPGKGRDIDGPVSSVRLDLNRDAMEDHNYLKTLEQVSSREYAGQVTQRLIPGYLKEMNLDPDLYHSLRQFIVAEISRLKSGEALVSKKEGIVKDSAGNTLEGAEVVTDYFGATTDSNGQYEVYYKSDDTITVSLTGFKNGTGKAGDTVSLTAVNSKLLVSFENVNEPYEVGSGSGNVVTQYATQGNKSMKLTVAKNGEGEIGVDVPASLQNWTSYNYLVWDVYNSGSTGLTPPR